MPRLRGSCRSFACPLRMVLRRRWGAVALWIPSPFCDGPAGSSLPGPRASGACSLRLIVGWFLSLRLIRSSQSEVPQAIEKLLGRVHSALLTTRKMPRLLVGERVTWSGGFRMASSRRPVACKRRDRIDRRAITRGAGPHELAHVRRYDFLVNALQRGVESMLFYHPGVWWLSSRVRKEREHCCDDLAVRVCGDRFAYAKALIELEKMRSESLALAVSATGSLTERVRRMLGAEDRNRDWQPAMAALLLLGICAVAGLWQGDAFLPSGVRGGLVSSGARSDRGTGCADSDSAIGKRAWRIGSDRHGASTATRASGRRTMDHDVGRSISSTQLRLRRRKMLQQSNGPDVHASQCGRELCAFAIVQ